MAVIKNSVSHLSPERKRLAQDLLRRSSGLPARLFCRLTWECQDRRSAISRWASSC
jgi:hypothetical protein